MTNLRRHGGDLSPVMMISDSGRLNRGPLAPHFTPTIPKNPGAGSEPQVLAGVLWAVHLCDMIVVAYVRVRSAAPTYEMSTRF